MPFSSNINTYHDVLQILQTARRDWNVHGKPLRYQRDTHAQATNWRGRAYKYRTLLIEAAKARTPVPGFVPTTEWDDLYLTIDGASVVITFGRPQGTLIGGEGNELEPIVIPVQPPVAEQLTQAPTQPIEELDLSQLEKTAQALKQKLEPKP